MKQNNEKKFYGRTWEEVVTEVDKNLGEFESLKKVFHAFAKEKVLTKRVYSHVWTSGSSTQVVPIGFHHNEMIIQMENVTNIAKAVQRVVANNPDLIEYGYVDKRDSSCPSSVVFCYTKQVKEQMLKEGWRF